MKLSLIYEATVDQVQRRIPIWTKKYFDDNEIDANWYIPIVIKADPTKGKYSEWLIRQFKNETARFPEDTKKLHDLLELFNRKKSKLDDRDLNNYTPGQLAKALDQQFDLTNSERRDARKGGLHLPPGAELVVSDGPYKAVRITDSKASGLLCSGTEWCVADAETADHYLEEGDLYLIYVDGERKFLVHYESDQFMDVYDAEVDPDIKFAIIKLLEPVTDMKIEDNAKWSYDYANFTHKRFPEGEEAISKDPKLSLHYAISVIHGPWPKGEDAIIQNSRHAVNYAMNVIKGPWPKGEKAIARHSGSALIYAKAVLKRPWPPGEKAIAKNGTNATLYAIDVIRGPWPEGEEAILDKKLQSPYIMSKNALQYAKFAIRGRWPKGEKIISSNPADLASYRQFLDEKDIE